jgi:hypothetical protein
VGTVGTKWGHMWGQHNSMKYLYLSISFYYCPHVPTWVAYIQTKDLLSSHGESILPGGCCVFQWGVGTNAE